MPQHKVLWFLSAFLPVLLLSNQFPAWSAPNNRDQHQQPKQPQSSTKKPSILTDVFKSQFKPEELKALGPSPSLDKLSQSMSPEQKSGATSQLKSLETKTSDPKVLAEISQGYQLLGKHHDMLRVGTSIQKLRPKSSRGFSISANASLQLKNYADAVIQAKKALKRNPEDKAAFGALMLSVGRIGYSGDDKATVTGNAPSKPNLIVLDTRASPKAMDLMRQAVASRKSGDMEKTWSLVQEAMRTDPASKVVQDFYLLAQDDYRRVMGKSRTLTPAQKALTNDESEKTPTDGSFPLWPAYTMVGLGALGYGVSRSMGTWKEQESEQQQEPIFESPEAQTAYYEAQKKKYEGIHTVLKHTRNGAIVFLFVGGGILTWQAAAPLVGPYVTPILVKIKEPVVRAYDRLTKAFSKHSSKSPSVQFVQSEGPTLTNLTKQAARQAVTKLNLPKIQMQETLRSLRHSTSSERIQIIQKEGGDLLLRTTRPGTNGYQAFEYLIKPNGAKSVIQKAYNAAGNLVHNDPKLP